MELKSSLITHTNFKEVNKNNSTNRAERQKKLFVGGLSIILDNQNNLELLHSPDYIGKKMGSTPSQAHNEILWT